MTEKSAKQENTQLQNVDTNTGEILTTGEIIVQDTDKFTIVQLPDGKFRKDMKYKKYFSKVPENDKELVELYKLLNTEDNEDVTPMKFAIGKEIEIHQVYTNPYQSFDENTGGNTNGVTTTIFDGQDYFATSSKSVYHTIMNLFEVFGHPNTPEYKPIKVKIVGNKRENGIQINLELQYS